MLIKTRNFGEIEINSPQIIEFIEGIPGFDSLTKFVIIDNPDPEVPFKWLQSTEDGDFAFVIINPFIFKPDYDFELKERVIEKLEITAHEDVKVYSIVVVPEDITKMTANLAAPLIINTKNKRAKQVILEGDNYSIRHYILDEMQKVIGTKSSDSAKKEEAL